MDEKSRASALFPAALFASPAEPARQAFARVPVCIATLDREGNFLEVNQAFARLYKQPPEYFAGKNAFDLNPSPQGRAIFEQVIAQGAPHTSYNNPYIDPDHTDLPATYWDWTLYPDVDPTGAVSGVIFIAQDVTARQQAEQSLAQSRALFELIFETAPDANILVDQTGLILAVNRQLEALFGYTRKELVGRMIETLIPDTFCEQLALLQAAYTADPLLLRSTDGREMVGHHRDGGDLPIRVALNPLQTEEGLRILVTIRDLSAVKMAEQNLRDSQGRLQAIFDNAPVGIQLLDEGGNIITTNGVMQAMLGYTSEELQHMNFLGFTFEGDWVVNLNKLQQLLRREINSFHLEKRYRRKDGSLFWGRLNVSRYDQEEDNLHYLIAMVENINDFKESEIAREQSEARFRASVESMLAGFAILSCVRDENRRVVDFCFDFINEAGCQLDQLTREEHIGHTLLEISPALSNTGLVEQYIHVLETGKPLAVEIAGADRPPGVERFYDIQASPLGDGIAVWWTETTARKTAEKVVRRQEELLRAVIENLPVGLWITDRDGVIHYANRTGREIWGGASYVGRKWQDDRFGWWSSSGQRIQPEEWGVSRALSLGETSIEEEITILTPTGQHRNLLASAAPIWDDQLVITGAVIINQDITERVQMQAELAEVQRKLLHQADEQRLHLARELHDGPLQDLYGVSFHLNDLVNRLPESEENQLAVQTRDELQHVLSSLRQLMAELRPPTLAPFGLEKTIRSHAEEFKTRHPELSLHLDLARDGQTLPEPVRLALFRIYQESLNNILRHASATRVSIRFSFDSARAELLIIDDGVGFEAPEHWVELARGGHYGLVGMRERAEALGGVFELHSKPGQGTRFHVVIPLNRG